MHWGGLQPSVQMVKTKGQLALSSLRPWFSARERQIALLGCELLRQVRQYLVVLFISEGKMINKWTGTASVGMLAVCQTIVVNWELSPKAKLSHYLSL